MKYNKKEIMKNAWAIRRSTNCFMSPALKAAWAKAKEENTVEITGTEKQIAWANDIKVRAYKDLATLETAIQNGDKFCPTYTVNHDGEEIVVNAVRMTISVKDADGNRVKSRLNMDDLNAVKTALDAWFASKDGRNAGNIIDQRHNLSTNVFYSLMLQVHRDGDWTRSRFSEAWYVA